ncbi:Hypothetical protein CINCED_3A003807 [Cinara cedri]|uniref:Uncharacterized protein n=1 Tax=Cinara cedri TaxID=506608 RepID=A0A5E4MNB0_9HEMI|nr:Hypothetical protein CINCED_3A003807 [Cinara cedri]
MAGAGGRQQAAAAVAPDVSAASALLSQQQHAPPDYTSVAIEKLLHSIWDTKVNDIMAAINHLGLV